MVLGLTLARALGLTGALALVSLLATACGAPASSQAAEAEPSVTAPTSLAPTLTPTPSPSVSVRGTAVAPTPSASTTATTSASPPASPTPTPTAHPVDASALALLRIQLQCPQTVGVHVIASGAVVVLPGTEAVVAECAAGAGSPPSGVYTLTGSGAATQLNQTLVKPSSQVLVSALHLTAQGVQVVGSTFSTPTVPRCCPDKTVSLSWRAQGDQLVAQTG